MARCVMNGKIRLSKPSSGTPLFFRVCTVTLTSDKSLALLPFPVSPACVARLEQIPVQEQGLLHLHRVHGIRADPLRQLLWHHL